MSPTNRISQLSLALLLFPLFFAQAQTIPQSRWEWIGPSGANLKTLVRYPLTGDLLAGTAELPAHTYKSTDDGFTWQETGEVKVDYGRYLDFTVIDPQNPQNLIGVQWREWYGWQTPQANCSVLKSTDMGVSWTEKLFQGELGWTYAISKLRTGPSGSLIIMGYCYEAMAAEKRYFPFACISVDGGDTWSITRYANAGSGEMRSSVIATDPGSTSIKYIGGKNVIGSSESPLLLKTTNGGSSWTDITGQLFLGGVEDVWIDPSSPNKVYAVTKWGLYRSTDAGSSWKECRNSPADGALSGIEIIGDPKNSSVAYVYGVGTGIACTSDGGQTWMLASAPLEATSVSRIIVNPLQPNKLYASTSGGFFRSDYSGRFWSMANAGMRNAPILAVTCLPSNPKTLYVSYKGWGVYRASNALEAVSTEGITWEKLPQFPFTASFRRIHIKDGPVPTLYTMQEPCQATPIFKSTTGGSSWMSLNFSLWGEDIKWGGMLYEVGAVLDPVKSVYQFAVARSADDGSTWSITKLEDTSSVAEVVAIDPSNTNVVYVGGRAARPNRGSTVEAEIFKSTDGGVSWQKIYKGDGWFRALTIDPNNPNRILAGNVRYVIRSSDAGRTWTSTELSSEIRTLVINPVNSAYVYAGRTKGVWMSRDSGKTWSDFSDGLGTEMVDAMDIDPVNQVLYVGTHVDGVFRRQLPVDAAGKPISPFITHRIALSQGWNMVSSYVAPSDSTLDSVFVKLRVKPTIVKNGSGQIYWPGMGINTIGKWNYRSGYQLYMTTPDTLVLKGDEVNPLNTSFVLPQGWSTVSYIRNSPMDADSAFANLKWANILAKDNTGKVYWSSLVFNTLGALKPGQGYQVYLQVGSSFNYPQNAGTTPPEQLSKTSNTIAHRLDEASKYGRELRYTGVSASLMVEGSPLVNGGEVGVWTKSGQLVGCGLVQEGRAAVTIWGDDVMTDEKDGASPEEELKLTLWSATDGSERQLQLTNVADVLASTSHQTLRFAPDGIFVASIEAGAEQVPQTFALGQNYPNPFNPATVIRFEIPTAAFVTLKIFDLIGREVATLVEGVRPPGTYSVRWDASSMPSGVYFYTLRAGEYAASKKMTLMK